LKLERRKRLRLKQLKNMEMRLNQMLKLTLRLLMRTQKLEKEELERSKLRKAALMLISHNGWLSHQTNVKRFARPYSSRGLLLV
jgi:hypothetical protein